MAEKMFTDFTSVVIPSEQKIWLYYIIFNKESDLYHGTFSIFVNKDLRILKNIGNQRMSAV